jgi:hypothetical protein
LSPVCRSAEGKVRGTFPSFPVAKGDPLWWSSSMVADERFIVKFA